MSAVCYVNLTYPTNESNTFTPSILVCNAKQTFVFSLQRFRSCPGLVLHSQTSPSHQDCKGLNISTTTTSILGSCCRQILNWVAPNWLRVQQSFYRSRYQSRPSDILPARVNISPLFYLLVICNSAWVNKYIIRDCKKKPQTTKAVRFIIKLLLSFFCF